MSDFTYSTEDDDTDNAADPVADAPPSLDDLLGDGAGSGAGAGLGMGDGSGAGGGTSSGLGGDPNLSAPTSTVQPATESSLPPWSQRGTDHLSDAEPTLAYGSLAPEDPLTTGEARAPVDNSWGTGIGGGIGAGSGSGLGSGTVSSVPSETSFSAGLGTSSEEAFFAEPQPAQTRIRPRTSDRNLGVAVITGAALIGIAWLAFALGERVTLALITIVLLVGLAEFYSALTRVKYRPAALVGYVATVGLSVGAFWQGEAAYPIVLGLAFVFAMLWYLFGVSERMMLPDLAATFLGIAYVGVLGSFGALLLTFEDGVYLVVGAVIVSVGYDIGGWVVGRLAGRTPLSSVSPGKTVEGLIGGMLLAFLGAVVLLSVFGWEPWVDPGSSGDRIVFALVACVAAPLGDLSQSLLKRNLEVKDMGFLLPGHGGILDRFDSLLFVLPACYFVVRVTDLAVLA